jgi:hypothetical protein
VFRYFPERSSEFKAHDSGLSHKAAFSVVAFDHLLQVTLPVCLPVFLHM